MSKQISLCGLWELIGKRDNKAIKIQAHVPGHVHPELERTGIIPPMFWRDNADRCQWVEKENWIYTRTFKARKYNRGEKIMLRFEGLDTVASIKLNGIELGRTENMFIPHEFEVTSIIKSNNSLSIFLENIHSYLNKKSRKQYSAAFSVERVYLRKMQCAFGWDWVHRFVSAGIWRPVTLRYYKEGRIIEHFIETLSINKNQAVVSIKVNVNLWTKGSYKLVIEIVRNRKMVFTLTCPILSSQISKNIKIKDPALWWPNGHGKQEMYQLKISLFADSKQIDEHISNFGIRTIKLEQIPDKKGSSFTLIVNGKRTFAKGGNWVQADPFPGRISRDKYKQLIKLAKEGNFNILRSWGGGIYEPPAFWDACDKYGIMVIQDFLMACAHYPEDQEDFLGRIRTEIEVAIKMLKNHPSLILWSGDNELSQNENSGSMYNGRKTWETITEPLLKNLDPNRPRIPTSPFSSIAGQPNNSKDSGDCHISPWYHLATAEDISSYRKVIPQYLGRFISESAVCGSPPICSLKKFMTEKDIADRCGAMWEYHTKDNPYNNISLTHVQLLERNSTMMYGTKNTVDRFIAGRELLQAEVASIHADTARTAKFDCSGIIFWMYNDCWPASGWSLVDYWGLPKAGFYGVKRAFSPIIVTIQEAEQGLKVNVVNDLNDYFEGILQIYATTFSGKKIFEKTLHITCANNSSTCLIDLCWDEIGMTDYKNQCVVANISKNNKILSQRIYFQSLPKELQLPKTKLFVEWVRYKNSRVKLKISTEALAFCVTVNEELVMRDNYFHLPPKTSRIIEGYSLSNKLPKNVHVSCWNQ